MHISQQITQLVIAADEATADLNLQLFLLCLAEDFNAGCCTGERPVIHDCWQTGSGRLAIRNWLFIVSEDTFVVLMKVLMQG